MCQNTFSPLSSSLTNTISSQHKLISTPVRREQAKCSKDSETKKSVASRETFTNEVVDVAIGLTEGWVAGIARGEPVRIIGSYVKSPLRATLLDFC